MTFTSNPKLSEAKDSDCKSSQAKAETERRLIRYKSETAATAAEIAVKSDIDLVLQLRKMFRKGSSTFGYSEEYHISLLVRLPQSYESNLPMLYMVDEIKDGTAVLSEELARMRPFLDFDGKENENWENQLAEAFLDTRHFIARELRPRGLELERDFDVHLTGGKGFRVTFRGMTPIGTPGALADTMKLWCQDRNELYPTLDSGIYSASINGGFIRGVGSKHPKTGLWSIFLNQKELFELPPMVAIKQITDRARMTDSKALRMRREMAPLLEGWLGLKEPPSPALTRFLQEFSAEADELAWIEKLRPTTPNPKQINLKALIESEGLAIRSYIQEGQVALLKSCPECGKEGKAWVTSSGRLRCFRGSCSASDAQGGLSLSQWASGSDLDQLIDRKAPKGTESHLCKLDVLHSDLLEAKERFFGEDGEAPSILERVSASCGKTTIALEGALEAILRGESIAFTTPTHKLSDEKVIWLEQEALKKGIKLPILRWHGRGAIDNLGPMCTQPERVANAEKHGLPINQAACRGCPIFQICRYQGQYRKLLAFLKAQKEEGKGFLFVGSHHALWGLMQAELFTPARVIIDEDPSNACIREYELSLQTLHSPYAEPKGLESSLGEAIEPARKLLIELVERTKELRQKDHDRAHRQAQRKGSKWVPRTSVRAAQDGLIELLLDLAPDASETFKKALETLEEAKEEVLSRDEEERQLWITALSSVFRYLPTLEAFTQILSAQTNEKQARGFSVELEFQFEHKNHRHKEGESRSHRGKLIGGTFKIIEARVLPYEGPVMGLDATGELLPWEAMLGRKLELLRRDAPLHPESKVDWIELGTYQSTLLKEDRKWLEKYLLPQVKYHRELGERVLIITWMKEGPEGSYKQKVIQFLEEKGFSVDGIQLDVIHFFAERGHNCWRDWDASILWGMPVENPDALRMKSQALCQLLPLHQREELREQLFHQCSVGEALQDVNRVGAIEQAKQWTIFASSKFLPLTDYLEEIAAPGKFRKIAGRSNEAKDPQRLEKLEEISQKIASVGFCNSRVIAGLMGLDPVGRAALIRMGLLRPEEYPMGRLPQGFDHIPIGDTPRDEFIIREVIETYSAKGFEALLGRREQQRITQRVLELTSWFEASSKVTLETQDGTIRPYQIHGAAEEGRQFLELCLELEGQVEWEKKPPDLTAEGRSGSELLRERCNEVLGELFDSEEAQATEWPDDALLWVVLVARQVQWEREQGVEGVLGEEEQRVELCLRGPP